MALAVDATAVVVTAAVAAGRGEEARLTGCVGTDARAGAWSLAAAVGGVRGDEIVASAWREGSPPLLLLLLLLLLPLLLLLVLVVLTSSTSLSLMFLFTSTNDEEEDDDGDDGSSNGDVFDDFKGFGLELTAEAAPASVAAAVVEVEVDILIATG